jgi:prevent-host-death family protein
MSILNDLTGNMKTLAEAREEFCEIVDLAIRGQSTTITRRNKPVARVVPTERNARRLTEEWRRRVAAIRLNRKGQAKLTISQLIQEGRK